jgi:hypothetical protein
MTGISRALWAESSRGIGSNTAACLLVPARDNPSAHIGRHRGRMFVPPDLSPVGEYEEIPVEAWR